MAYVCAPVIQCLCTHAETQTEMSEKHLLAGEEFSLVFVDDGVTCGHFAILIPSHWTQEISGVCQTIGSCQSNTHNITHPHTNRKNRHHYIQGSVQNHTLCSVLCAAFQTSTMQTAAVYR